MKISSFNQFRPERIKMDARCPVCGSMYDLRQLEIIQEEDGMTLLYIKCSSCQSAALSIVALGPFGIKMASILTDLDQHEVLRFQDMESLESNDVLELHEALEKGDRFLESII